LKPFFYVSEHISFKNRKKSWNFLYRFLKMPYIAHRNQRPKVVRTRAARQPEVSELTILLTKKLEEYGI